MTSQKFKSKDPTQAVFEKCGEGETKTIKKGLLRPSFSRIKKKKNMRLKNVALLRPPSTASGLDRRAGFSFGGVLLQVGEGHLNDEVQNVFHLLAKGVSRGRVVGVSMDVKMHMYMCICIHNIYIYIYTLT